MVKGSAGTGKSLVLLKALEKAFNSVGENELDLGLSEGKRILLLTYTTTLTKYNQYLSEVLGIQRPEETVMTVGAYLEEKLKNLQPDATVSYTVWKELAKQFAPSFMKPREFENEVEEFIWGNAVSRCEYIDEMIPRTGTGFRMERDRREAVWDAAEQAMAAMGPEHSRGAARVKVLEYLRTNPDDETFKDIDYLFLDESQDLTAAELMLLKNLTTRAVIMVGDTDQSIYARVPPYARAGIELRGHTRILKTNFRNTIQIHDAAERFRQIRPELGWDGDTGARAFREGPTPELYVRPKAEGSLSELLADKVRVFVERVGYAPENITVLLPYNNLRSRLESSFERIGYGTSWVHDEEFDFKAEGAIRLCSLHSSKGLDFPVVMMYLPYLYPPKDALDEKKLRNLIYVGMTRAMDNLNVFMESADESTILGDLANCVSNDGSGTEV